MAKFESPIDTANILRAQTEGTGRIVRDQSAEILAGAINQTIKTGADIAKAATVAPLEREINKDLVDFSEAKFSTGQDDLLSQLQGAADDVESATSAGNDATLNKATAEFQTLDRQRRLGNMSASQVKLMAEAKLRRYVNENPFFRSELVDAHDNVLGLHRNELAAIDALDAAKKTQDQTLYKFYAPIVAKMGVNIIGLGTDELAAIATPELANISANEKLQRTEVQNEQQAEGLFYGNENNALKGNYSAFTLAAQDLLASFRTTPGTSIDEFSAEVRALEQSHVNNLNFNFGRFIDRAHLDSAGKAFSSASDVIIAAVQNNMTAEQVQNRVKIQKGNLEANALINPAMQSAYVASTLAPAWVESNVLFTNNAGIARGMINYITNLSSGMAIQTTPPVTPTARKGAQQTGLIVRDAISKNLPQSDEDWSDIYKSVGTMSDIISQRDFSSEEMDNVLSTGAMPEVVNLVKNSPEMGEKLRRGTESLLAETLIPQLGATLNQQLEVRTLPAVLARGDSQEFNTFKDAVTMNVSQDGMITFQAKDIAMSPTERGMVENKVDTMNKNIGRNINKAIRTLAHVNGSTNYLNSAQSLLGRFNLAQFPSITGELSLTRPPLDETPIQSDGELRQRAIGGDREAAIMLFDRQLEAESAGE